MSGTFENLNVPPTLVAFGVGMVKASEVISPEFKWDGDRIYLIKHTPKADHMPDTDALKRNWDFVREGIASGEIISAWAVGEGGVAEALAKMSFGNEFGVRVNASEEDLFSASFGSIIVESHCELKFPGAVLLGQVTDGEDGLLHVNGARLPMEALLDAWKSRYDGVYPKTCVAEFETDALSNGLCPETDLCTHEKEVMGKRPIDGTA